MKEEKTGALAEKQRALLEIAEEETDNLSCPIGKLMDISRIEAGKFEVKLDCLDIKAVVSRVVDSLKHRADEKRIVLKDSSPSRIPYVLGDKKRMTQILTNLLGNAIKFTSENWTISVFAKEEANTVEFSIADSGIGIEKDKIDKIFDKFYQADSTGTRRYDGCGLGFAITKSVIELHRGKIWVESKLGVGSKFFFELEKYKKGNKHCEKQRS